MNQFTETIAEKQQTLSEIASQIETFTNKKKMEILNQFSVPEITNGLNTRSSSGKISVLKIFGGGYTEGIDYIYPDEDDKIYDHVGTGPELQRCVKFKEEVVKGADIETFETLSYGYAKDQNNVYFEENKIDGADLETFEMVFNTPDTSYCKDKSSLYFNGEKIEGANPENFKISKEGAYLESEGFIYFYGEETEIEEDDIDLLTSSNDGYLIGENFIYHDGKKTKLNPETCEFVQFSGDKNKYKFWLRDEKFVYLGGKLVEGANPDTFENIDEDYFRDDKTIFYGSKAIKADRETFELIENKGYGNLAKDKDNIYINGRKKDIKPENIEKLNDSYFRIDGKIYYLNHADTRDFGADASTFEVLNDFWAKDKDNYYYEDKKIEGFDPKVSRFIDVKKEGFKVNNRVIAIGGGNFKIDYIILDDEKAYFKGDRRQFLRKHNLFEEDDLSLEFDEPKEVKKGIISRVLELVGIGK